MKLDKEELVGLMFFLNKKQNDHFNGENLLIFESFAPFKLVSPFLMGMCKEGEK